MKSLRPSYSRISENDDSGETEAIPFLDSEKGSTDCSSLPLRDDRGRSESPCTSSLQRVKSLFSPRWFFIHGFAFVIYTALFICLVVRSSLLKAYPDTRSSLGLYSPAIEALQYEARPVDGLAEGSVYAGYPRPESEAAWRTLMQGSNVKIYPEEMVKLNETSLQMRDGSGSLAVLGVYHELHCVKRLRKWLYKEYYYPNQTELEFNERFTHAEHCLEFLRQAAMCHGDITVTSFKWLHDAQGHVIEPTTKEGARHQCVRWEGISAWAQKRRVNLFDPTLLVPEGGHAKSQG